LGQTKDYKIGICCFSAKHTALRRMSKDWMALNQDNVSEWGDMSIIELHYKLGLEPTIYCTQGEHVNHYTTDAVKIVSIIITTLCICTKEVFLNYKEMKEFTDEQR
jgi:hypothetical protein